MLYSAAVSLTVTPTKREIIARASAQQCAYHDALTQAVQTFLKRGHLMSSIVAMQLSSICLTDDAAQARVLRSRFALVTRVRSLHALISIAPIRNMENALKPRNSERRMIVGELDRKPGRGIEIYRLLESSRPGITPKTRIVPSIGEVRLEFKNEVPLRFEAQFDLLQVRPFDTPVSLVMKGIYIPWSGEILMAGGKL